MTAIQTQRAITNDSVSSESDRQYTIRVSTDVEDVEWDAFLAQRPHGNHVQTSVWAQVKASQGWRAMRVIATLENRIVAGAQLLVRNTRIMGRVGYVPKGPVLCLPDAELTRLVIATLHKLASDHSIRILFVQPPDNSEHFAAHLPVAGFRPSPIETAPTATVVVKLDSDLDAILARMRKGMRNGIRQSERKGIRVREGTKDDLPTFHRLLKATSERRGFSPFECDYFDHMWRILAPRGHLKLFLSEYHDETISAQLVIPFGETVVAKQIGWSGRYGSLKPNEGLDWATIQWAKAQGYRYYDLEGIEPLVARTILDGLPMPKTFAATPTAYKLRLGGEICLFPESYCYLQNPILRGVYNRVGYRIAQAKYIQDLVGRFRTQ